NNTIINWQDIESNKDGTYSKSKVNAYLKNLQATHHFDTNSDEARLVQIDNLLIEEKTLKSEIKEDTEVLHQKTKLTIETLTDEQVNTLLSHKWIVPLVQAMAQLADDVVSHLTSKVQALADKYADTYIEIASQLSKAENELADLLDELVGNEF